MKLRIMLRNPEQPENNKRTSRATAGFVSPRFQRLSIFSLRNTQVYEMRGGLRNLPKSILKLDGRSKSGRIGKHFRASLVDEVGGNPTPMQAALIDEATRLRLSLLAYTPCDALSRLMEVRRLLGLGNE